MFENHEFEIFLHAELVSEKAKRYLAKRSLQGDSFALDLTVINAVN